MATEVMASNGFFGYTIGIGRQYLLYDVLGHEKQRLNTHMLASKDEHFISCSKI